MEMAVVTLTAMVMLILRIVAMIVTMSLVPAEYDDPEIPTTTDIFQ